MRNLAKPARAPPVPPLQVISTFMRFSEGEVVRVHAARSKRSRFSLAPLFTSAARDDAPSRVGNAGAGSDTAAAIGLPVQPVAQSVSTAVSGADGEDTELCAQLREATRRYTTAEARLQKAEQELREQPTTGGTNLAYLRHVLIRYLALGDAEEEGGALFQVIATFLQFDEADIFKLQSVRQRKAAAQAGILGQAASLFLSKARA
eukprot:207918-Prymnesium_polylepis.1